MQSIRIDDDELDCHLTLVLSDLKKAIDVRDGNAAVKIYTAASLTDTEPILDRIRELLRTDAEVDINYTRSLPHRHIADTPTPPPIERGASCRWQQAHLITAWRETHYYRGHNYSASLLLSAPA